MYLQFVMSMYLVIRDGFLLFTWAHVVIGQKDVASEFQKLEIAHWYPLASSGPRQVETVVHSDHTDSRGILELISQVSPQQVQPTESTDVNSERHILQAFYQHKLLALTSCSSFGTWLCHTLPTLKQFWNSSGGFGARSRIPDENLPAHREEAPPSALWLGSFFRFFVPETWNMASQNIDIENRWKHMKHRFLVRLNGS